MIFLISAVFCEETSMFLFKNHTKKWVDGLQEKSWSQATTSRKKISIPRHTRPYVRTFVCLSYHKKRWISWFYETVILLQYPRYSTVVVFFQIHTTVVRTAYCQGADTVPYFGPYISRVPLPGGTRGGAGCTRDTYDACSFVPQFHQKNTVQGSKPYGTLYPVVGPPGITECIFRSTSTTGTLVPTSCKIKRWQL